MALYPKLVDRPSRDVETGHIYVLVDFYPTLRDRRNETNRVLREEFIMQLPLTRPTYDPDGNVIGEETLDVRTTFRENIQKFIHVHDAKGTRGDLTGEAMGRRRLRDNVDTDGVLAMLATEELP